MNRYLFYVKLDIKLVFPSPGQMVRRAPKKMITTLKTIKELETKDLQKLVAIMNISEEKKLSKFMEMIKRFNALLLSKKNFEKNSQKFLEFNFFAEMKKIQQQKKNNKKRGNDDDDGDDDSDSSVLQKKYKKVRVFPPPSEDDEDVDCVDDVEHLVDECDDVDPLVESSLQFIKDILPSFKIIGSE